MRNRRTAHRTCLRGSAAFPARANPGWADFSGMFLSMAKPETNKELQNR
jgi:hypothetical protein